MNTTTPNKKQAIAIFQGGGALGAYECGAFEIIASYIDEHDEELAVAAGVSIGAINAAIIARSYQDQKTRTGTATAKKAAEDLKIFWTTVLPNPSPPLLPPSLGLQLPFAEIMQRYLNLWINVLQGNRHIFTPDPYALSPFAPAHYNMNALEEMLKDHFGTYSGSDPRLIVAAVNVQSGHMKIFDSGGEMITPEMIVACGSIPPYVPAKKVGDEYYWDGGLWSNTPLGDVMNALQPPHCDGQPSGNGTTSETFPTYQVYLVNDHPHQGPLPQDLIGVQERELDIMLADKSDYDIKISKRINQYIDLVQRLRQLPLSEEVEQEVNSAYDTICKKKWARLDIIPFKRGGLPYDYWSSIGDFSVSRINELIAQGKRETQQQLEDRCDWDEERA